MRREARGCDIGGSGRANAAILAEGRDWGLGIGDWGFGIGDWGFECGSGFSRELCLGPSPCEGRGRLGGGAHGSHRSEEHTSELQSIMRISYAVFCLKKKTSAYI